MANETLANSTNVASSDHAGLLGALWAVYGIVHLVIALVLIFFNGIAKVMFGALLTRVPNPFALMTDFHILYVFIIVWNILSGIVALAAAAGLLGRVKGAENRDPLCVSRASGPSVRRYAWCVHANCLPAAPPDVTGFVA